MKSEMREVFLTSEDIAYTTEKEAKEKEFEYQQRMLKSKIENCLENFYYMGMDLEKIIDGIFENIEELSGAYNTFTMSVEGLDEEE